MILIKLTGGLGNQMFQYAFAKSLQNFGYEVKLDISSFETYTLHGGFQLNSYHITLPIASKTEITPYNAGLLAKIGEKFKLVNRKFLREPTLLFRQQLLSPPDNKTLYGYFQNEKYFIAIKKTILQDFVLKAPLSDYANALEKNIISKPNTVSIHIRRGDYVNNLKTNKFHGICDLNYYYRAISLLESKYEELHYFVFSDDIDWVKKNFICKNCTYIDDKQSPIPHEAIYLMSLCRHNIIANSSFSWWGAWLNRHPDKIVIAPEKWFADARMLRQSSDIVPKTWIRL